MTEVDVIVIGAGAAGLMCAIEAGKRGRKTLILEHNDRIGRKILISGGGRCNFTNRQTPASSFVSANPHFAKSALARYTPQDFIALVEKHGISYHEKKLGQLFCDHSARDIVKMLEDECKSAGVMIEVNGKVLTIEKTTPRFTIKTTTGDYACSSVVIATGGLSIPKIGATDFGYKIAKQFGLRIIEPRPALVPFLFDNTFVDQYGELAGISFDSLVKADSAVFREHTLFTHRGLSGPAILQCSLYWNAGDAIVVAIEPESDIETLLKTNRSSKAYLSTVLNTILPKRFAEAFCADEGLNKPLNQLSEKSLNNFINKIKQWKLLPIGTEGFQKAEVTAGGVDTDELSSKTMEAKKVPGLFFIGEVVDVTGWLGGYNFQWAWSSGWAAGQAV
jgi:predicted Rossmann fold flavoprotein